MAPSPVYRPGSYEFHQFNSAVSTTPVEFKVSTDGYCREIRFCPTSAAPTTLAVSVRCGSELVLDQVYLICLPAVVSAATVGTPAQYGCFVFRPERPLRWAVDVPIKVTASVTCAVFLMGAEGMP